MAYRKQDKVFVQVSDLERARKLADGFASVDWVRVLGRYPRQVNPRLLTSSTLYFEAHDVLCVLGRTLTGNFLGDVVTYQLGFGQMPTRLPGRRVKHSRRWRVSRTGRRVMAATVKLREVAHPSLYAEAA